MAKKEEKGIEFDPGFGPYILALEGTVQYLYTDINRFKNLSQKKVKFMQYHKKLLDVFYNNVGFYTGCLMWASYILTQPKQKILGNHCFGKEYDEEQNIAETQYMLNFINLFPKDMKYFLGKDFAFDKKVTKLVEVYEEFLKLNKGFTSSEFNTDIVLPKGIKAYKDTFKTLVDKSVSEGNLNQLSEHISEIV